MNIIQKIKNLPGRNKPVSEILARLPEMPGTVAPQFAAVAGLSKEELTSLRDAALEIRGSASGPEDFMKKMEAHFAPPPPPAAAPTAESWWGTAVPAAAPTITAKAALAAPTTATVSEDLRNLNDSQILLKIAEILPGVFKRQGLGHFSIYDPATRTKANEMLAEIRESEEPVSSSDLEETIDNHYRGFGGYLRRRATVRKGLGETRVGPETFKELLRLTKVKGLSNDNVQSMAAAIGHVAKAGFPDQTQLDVLKMSAFSESIGEAFTAITSQPWTGPTAAAVTTEPQTAVAAAMRKAGMAPQAPPPATTTTTTDQWW